MKISIITATFNSAATVRDTFESVLQQSYHEIEYIVVDGGSRDETIEIIKEYEPRFGGRMKWKSEPDRGIYDAMNKGIQRATGVVVGILNSDDFFTSTDIISRIAETFSKDNALDMVYGDIHFVSSSDLSKCIRYYSSKIFRRTLFRFGFMPAHPSCYLRRECYQKYGLYSLKYKIAADFELLVRFIWRHKIKIKYLALDMVTMRIGGASTAGWKSYLHHNREDVIACHENGLWTCLPLLGLKYIYKVWELRF